MDEIAKVLTRGVDKIYPSPQMLEKVLRTGKKIRLYQGFDPTGIQLHIGHLAGLLKLKQFQQLGHQVIFLIGDGTGQAGDPSGKSRTRDKFLDITQLRNNAGDYVRQAGKIIDFEGKNKAEILFNSAWLNKLVLKDILEIAGHFSLAQLEERDLYTERKKKGKTEGNVIALTSPPNELFGLIMTLPDDVIVPALTYITQVPLDEIEE